MATDFNNLVAILYRMVIAKEKAMPAISKNAYNEYTWATLAKFIIYLLEEVLINFEIQQNGIEDHKSHQDYKRSLTITEKEFGVVDQ